MNNHMKIEDVFLQIRSVLQEDNVKLWLPPYYNESIGACEEEIQVKQFGKDCAASLSKNK